MKPEQRIFKNKRLHLNLSKKSEELVIIISGLSGSMQSSLVQTAQKYFNKEYTTLIFNFCNDDKLKNNNTFDIRDLSQDAYVSILVNILNELKKDYRKITVIGHSFSAAIILLTALEFKDKDLKLVMWDPSILSQLFESIKKYLKYDFERKEYYDVSDRKKGLVFSKKMIDSFELEKDPLRWIKKLDNEILIVGAERGAKRNAEAYYQESNKNKVKLKIIKNTGHFFGNYKARKSLLEETYNFIRSI